MPPCDQCACGALLRWFKRCMCRFEMWALHDLACAQIKLLSARMSVRGLRGLRDDLLPLLNFCFSSKFFCFCCRFSEGLPQLD